MVSFPHFLLLRSLIFNHFRVQCSFLPWQFYVKYLLMTTIKYRKSINRKRKYWRATTSSHQSFLFYLSCFSIQFKAIKFATYRKQSILIKRQFNDIDKINRRCWRFHVFPNHRMLKNGKWCEREIEKPRMSMKNDGKSMKISETFNRFGMKYFAKKCVWSQSEDFFFIKKRFVVVTDTK